ncbi:hypothetical protein DID96_29905 [Burkholderia sp. Bp8963]|nr:hypothetical protein DID96_29905 [Burkholderia sp. Bp8963]
MAAVQCSVHGRGSGVNLTRTAAELLYGGRAGWAAGSRLVKLMLEDDGVEWLCFILESDALTFKALGGVRDADGNYRIVGEDAAWAALATMTAACHGCLLEMKRVQDNVRDADEDGNR